MSLPHLLLGSELQHKRIILPNSLCYLISAPSRGGMLHLVTRAHGMPWMCGKLLLVGTELSYVLLGSSSNWQCL